MRRITIYAILISLVVGVAAIVLTLAVNFPEKDGLLPNAIMVMAISIATAVWVVLDVRKSWENVEIIGSEVVFERPDGESVRIQRGDVRAIERRLYLNPLNLISLKTNDGRCFSLRVGVGVGGLSCGQDPLTDLKQWWKSGGSGSTTAQPRKTTIPPRRI